MGWTGMEERRGEEEESENIGAGYKTRMFCYTPHSARFGVSSYQIRMAAK